MRKFLFFGALMALSYAATAQKFMTRNGHIWFFSKAPMEDIEAHNRQVTSIIDFSSGEIAVKVLIKSFEFEKAAMQEHFNRDYLESDKFPKATFEGKLTNLKSVDYTKDGTYPANVSGKLNIHNVSQDITASGSIKIAGGKVFISSKFTIKLIDYDVKIPSDYVKKIAQNIDINVDLSLEPYTR